MCRAGLMTCCFLVLGSSAPRDEHSELGSDEKMLPVICLPIGVDEALVRATSGEVEESLPGTRCVIGQPKCMIDLSMAYVRRRNQYLADAILKSLPLPEDESRLVGIVDVDIYSSTLNFVFGIAELPGKRALISTYRLKLGNVSGELLIERLTKEIVHELGHTFGLRHCSNRKCVMCFSNSIADTDYKSARLCKSCFEAYSKAASKLLR